MNTKLDIKSFKDLTSLEVYQLAALRQAVFIVEQNCPYPDLDNLDLNCWHLLLFDNAISSTLIGCLRIIPPTKQGLATSLGRLVVEKEKRQYGLGTKLMKAGVKNALEMWPDHGITLSGQAHLKRFYENLDFEAVGDIYNEDGIPHQKFNYK